MEGPHIKKIDPKDPDKDTKISLYNGSNRLGDLINSIKRDQENLLLSIGTFFFGIFLSAYLHSVIFYILFGILLLLFLIFATIRNNKDLQKLRNSYGELVNKGDKIGINLRQKI